MNFLFLVGYWRSFVEFGWIVLEMFIGKKKDIKKKVEEIGNKD